MRSFFRNKPKQPPITDSVELLRQVEAKDAKFRTFQSTFFVLMLISLIVLVSLAYKIQTENHKLLTQQSQELQNVQNLGEQIKAQNKDLQQHIDCIVALFQTPNRQNLVISNIENCDINSLSTGQPLNSQSAGGTSGTQQNSSGPNGSTVPKSSPQPSQPTPTPAPTPQPQPNVIQRFTTFVKSLF